VLDGVAAPGDLESLFHGASVGVATAVPAKIREQCCAAPATKAVAQAAPKTDRDVLARVGSRLGLDGDPAPC